MFLIFTFTLAVSFVVVVRIGAVVFQLTGLEWSLAKFQSLSCFTGTGFTTKEAELITGNPQRRKIASILMVLGNAGLVIMIASFASSLVPQETLLSKLSKSYLPFELPKEVVVWVNLALMIVGVIVVYKIFTNSRLTFKLTSYLRKKIIKKEMFSKVSFEELLLATGGYGVSKVTLRGESPVLNKNLAESGLRDLGINILAIVRNNETITNPSAQTMIREGDELVCFGKLEQIRENLCSDTRTQEEKNTDKA